MQSIKNIQEEYQAKVIQFGQIALEKTVLEKKLKELYDFHDKAVEELTDLQQREKKLADELNAKYGQGTLDPKTGEFMPS